MTNALTEHREILARVLVDGGLDHAFTILPERITPPFAFVAPGTPYIDYEGATFGSFFGHFDVGVVARRGTNEAAAAELDDMILLVVDTITNDGRFQVNNVDRPGRIDINGQGHLACSIDVQTEIHR